MAVVDDIVLALTAARAGGAIVREAFGRAVDVERKGRFDPVTEVDRRSEAAIVARIRDHRPDDAIVAEEGGGDSTSGRRWIVDPLDGTVNFVHGIPQVAVSVGLYDGDEPLAGVVYDPLREEIFSAAAGDGARLNGERIAVSSEDSLERAVVATGFPYDHDQHAAEYAAVVAAVLERVNGVRRFGSAALDLAWTAAGRYEGYWELGVAPWDQAAGTLIVREAGGRVTDPWGKDMTPADRLIVASNGYLHEALRSIVEPLVPARLRP